MRARRVLALVITACLIGGGSLATATTAGASSGVQRAAAAAPPYYAMSMFGNLNTNVIAAYPPVAVGPGAVTSDFYGVHGAGVGTFEVGLWGTSGGIGVGHYTVGPTNQAAFVMSGANIYCSATSGSVDILQSEQDAQNTFLAVAVDYSVVCDNSLHIEGVVRFNSTVPYAAADVGAGPVSFGTVHEQVASAPKVLTVTNQGSLPHHVTGPSTLAGLDPTSFVIVGDTCTGVTLAPGETCTVTVVSRPLALGYLTAILNVPDESATGGRQLLLKTIGQYDATGRYKPTGSWRMLDTRKGTGAPKHIVLGGHTVHLVVGGRAPVAASRASTAVLNLTVVGASSAGFVTAYPTGTARPATSNINFPRGWTGSNMVTVKLGTSSSIDIYLSSGSAHLVADLIGYYGAPSTDTANVPYHPTISPFRMYDSRTAGGHHTPLASHYERQLGVVFNGVGNTTVRAVAINLTVTGVRNTGGYVLAYIGLHSSTEWSRSSTMNPRAHEAIATTTIVQTKACTTGWCAGQNASVFSVYNGAAGNVDFIVDVVGFYSSTRASGATVYQSLPTPVRLVDSRIAFGTTPFGPASTHTVSPPSTVAGYNTAALAANITAVKPTASTFLTLWPQIAGFARPGVSNLNVGAGRTIANAALLTVGESEDLNVYNASGRADAIIDVAGTFENFPPLVPPAGSPPRGKTTQPESATAAEYGTVGGSLVGPTAHPAS